MKLKIDIRIGPFRCFFERPVPRGKYRDSPNMAVVLKALQMFPMDTGAKAHEVAKMSNLSLSCCRTHLVHLEKRGRVYRKWRGRKTLWFPIRNMASSRESRG